MAPSIRPYRARRDAGHGLTPITRCVRGSLHATTRTRRLAVDKYRRGNRATWRSLDDVVRPQQKRLRERQARALAVLRFDDTLEVHRGCSIGRSLGFAPSRIRSIYHAVNRARLLRRGPALQPGG